jgi:hypothetical protein
MILFRCRGVALLVVILGLTAAHSQVLYTLESPTPDPEGYFGWGLCGPGDLNNDGFPDLVVGAPQEAAGAADTGGVYVFSGQDCGLLYVARPPVPGVGGSFGMAVWGAGDVNADGYDDLVVGAHHQEGGAMQAGRAYVLSGFNGQLLHALVSPNPESQGGFGWAVSEAGDLDGDGYGDVIVGAYKEDGGALVAGRAYVFSGDEGSVIHTLQSPSPEYSAYFGVSVARLGDVSGDGVDDIVIGALLEDGGAVRAGRVYVFSGQDGGLIRALESPNPEVTGEFGHSVCGLGDVNGDGYPDLAVGAMLEDGGATQAGRAYVISGQTWEVLRTLESPNPEWWGAFGMSVASAGDVNADGCPDLVVGTYKEDGGASNAGRAYIFDGGTGELLYTLQSANPQTDGFFGCHVCGVGDLNGDGHGEVLAGAHWENGGAWHAGRAYVFNGIEVPVELASFVCRTTGDGVLLEWVTYSETDNRGFHVHRSTDAWSDRHRITQHLIPGAGTTTAPQTYSYLDPVRQPGRYVYWLEQIDIDGSTAWHGPVTALVSPNIISLEGPFPNPAAGDVRLTIAVPGEGTRHVELRLYDAVGRLAAGPLSEEVEAGRGHEVTWSPDPNSDPGLYWWQLQVGDRIVRKPMVLIG